MDNPTDLALATEPAEPIETPFESRRALPSGGWVELRDPRDLRKKDKDAIVGAITANNAGRAGVEMENGVILAVVADWSVPYLPGAVAPHRNPALLGELTLADGNMLEGLFLEYKAYLFPDMPSVDGMGVPGSPTRPASV